MFNFRLWLLSESQHKYSSTQINLPHKAAKRILDWNLKHISEKDLYVEEDEYGRETEVHVTVLFGLHTNDINPVRPVVNRFSPFEITLGDISKFKSEKYDVLKINIESSVLREMNKSLQTLPHTSNHPNYSPHCTLAYIKSGRCENLVGTKPFDGMKIMISTIMFSSKDREKTPILL